MNLGQSWTLAAKDLLQTRRDRLAALFTFILPLIFTIFFGLIFGSNEQSRLPLGVVDLDHGAAAAQLTAELGKSTVVEPKTLTPGAVDNAVQDFDVAAAVVIPAGFSKAVDAGERPQLELIRIQGSSGAQSAIEAAQAVAGRFVAARLAARAALETVAAAGPAGRGAAPTRDQALKETTALLASPAIVTDVRDAGTSAGAVATGFEQSSPGMLINWILFSMLTVATGLVLERRNGTLRRLLTTRITSPSIITGKAASCFLVALIQTTILVVAGQVLFKVDYFRSPAALVMVCVTLCLLASSLGLLLATLFRTEPAVIAATVILSMSLAALGGAWFPLEIAGSTFAAIGHLLPTTWLLDGLKGIILKGWGPAEVVSGVAVALAYTAVFYSIAVWRFRFE